MDRQARKQFVLTRAAVERVELLSELERLRHSVGVPQLLRAAMGSALGTSMMRSWFGQPARNSPSAWAGMALALLRRHRIATAAFGLLTPMLRKRGSLRRLLIGGSLLGVAAWGATRWLRPERGR